MMEMNLKDIRISKDLMQKDIAKISGVSSPYYCLLEKGERVPSMKTAMRIASALNLTLDEFYKALMITTKTKLTEERGETNGKN